MVLVALFGESFFSFFFVSIFRSFYGLNGVVDVDIKNLTIDASNIGSKLFMLAYHQTGLADLLHLAAAKHLGSMFFASFDNDFGRCRDLIKNNFELEFFSYSIQANRVKSFRNLRSV